MNAETLRNLVHTSGRWSSVEEAQAVAEYLLSLRVTTPSEAAKILPYLDVGNKKYLMSRYGTVPDSFVASNGLRVVVES